jgi:hypothetical protein
MKITVEPDRVTIAVDESEYGTRAALLEVLGKTFEETQAVLRAFPAKACPVLMAPARPDQGTRAGPVKAENTEEPAE